MLVLSHGDLILRYTPTLAPAEYHTRIELSKGSRFMLCSTAPCKMSTLYAIEHLPCQGPGRRLDVSLASSREQLSDDSLLETGPNVYPAASPALTHHLAVLTQMGSVEHGEGQSLCVHLTCGSEVGTVHELGVRRRDWIEYTAIRDRAIVVDV